MDDTQIDRNGTESRRIIPRIQICLEISALSAACRICQFQSGRAESSDILRVLIDFEKPGEVLFRQLSFGRTDTYYGFRELLGGKLQYEIRRA